MKGATLPRIYTPPLPGRRRGDGPSGGCPCGCALTPVTSRGFAVVEWAWEILGVTLNPWQKWLLIHALELTADLFRQRFRTVLVLVARQNGKTLVKAVLTLWRMFEDGMRYCVGTAQDLSQAREVMNEVLVPMILDNPVLRDRFDPDSEDYDLRRGIWHKTLNDEYFRLDSHWRGGRAIGPHGPRYLIKAMNRKAGRGLFDVGEVNIDELREQTDHKGWAAVSKTVMANTDAQIWCMSNAGDSQSVVLNQLRGVALAGDEPTLFHAEWAAVSQDGSPQACELDDLEAIAQANPSLGYTLELEAILSALRTDPANVYRTEVLCQFVDVLNNAIDVGAWAACADAAGSAPEDVAPAICVDAAVEGEQVVAVSAALVSDGRVRLDLVGVWPTTGQARAGLADLKMALRPRALGWFPRGPASPLGATMRKLDGTPIKGEQIPEACMTLADYVDGRRVLHPDDPLLNNHVQWVGTVGSESSWTFDRGTTHGAWAAAGALHLLLNNPAPPKRRRRVIVPEGV